MATTQAGGAYRVGDQIVDANGKPTKLQEQTDEQEAGGGETEVNATDGAKELAKEKSLDLAKVTGTGEAGRITKADVETYIQSQTA